MSWTSLALCSLPLLPLFGAILNGLILRPAQSRKSGVLATFFAGASFVVVLFLVNASQVGPLAAIYPDFFLSFALSFDSLTAWMTLIITGIGTLIHAYSIGYMAEEPNAYRYFSYLNLFLSAMLLLVCAKTCLVLFIGWEGVGVCSYLLIGYWYHDTAKANAGMKAFLVNRIGDAGFVVGMLLCLRYFGTVDFSHLAEHLQTASAAMGHLLEPQIAGWTLMDAMALCFFIGACGKSAQLPLYLWLPDAMAGPTPVSALIHAATMVTAGVYLGVRLHPVFALSPTVLHIVACVGAATALFAAIIAVAQEDIKRVLAFSTVSQLGFMFLSLGASNEVGAVFHLMTHAFFKALLFLGAGSVIHALSGEQNLWKMGGLRKKMPFTFWPMLMGWAALCGLPPFAGFFSKDAILYSSLGIPHIGVALWLMGSLASLLTAFYMTRLLVLTFFGSYRGTTHAHESPTIMALPLAILAVGSVLAGWIQVPESWAFGAHWATEFLGKAQGFGPHLHTEGTVLTILTEGQAMGVAVSIAVMGCLGASFWYAPSRIAGLAQAASSGSWLTHLVRDQFEYDRLAYLLVVQPFRSLCALCARIIDPKIIDGFLNAVVYACRVASTLVSIIASGNVQFYLLLFLGGTVGLLWWAAHVGGLL